MDFHVKLQGPFWKNIKILRDQNELYLKLQEPNLKNKKKFYWSKWNFTVYEIY
jgi:hypothetical protein